MRQQFIVVVEKCIESGIDEPSSDTERAPGRCLLANDVHLYAGLASEFNGQAGMLTGMHDDRSRCHALLIEHAANRALQRPPPFWPTGGPYDHVYRQLHLSPRH
jgi:hypothetical protein